MPDKDADGLSAGSILRHTLILLGLPEDRIKVHLLARATTVNDAEERDRMQACDPSYIFVVDQGSRPGPPLIDQPHSGLIIDHHFATDADFPKDSEHVNACHSPPVATSALLTYEICLPLHEDVQSKCAWLAALGTFGDLGSTLKWEPPFPDMRETFKRYKKKTLNDAVAWINAPRRTASFDVKSAWDALCDATEPASILTNRRLAEARQENAAEVERCTHTAPKFSADGSVAVFRIKSLAQVHPIIATRWSGHLNSRQLEIVLVANEGYTPGKVNFSCRIARCARSRQPPVNIIEKLKGYASMSDPDSDGAKALLLERVGDSFARGHVQASGGIIDADHFEELMRIMQVGGKSVKRETDTSPAKKKSVIDPTQKNTLAGYFTKAT